MEKILAISEMTYKKMKEPAFFLLFLIAIFIGYCVSEMDVISFQQDDSALSVILASNKGIPLLAGFVLILFISLLIAMFFGATDIPRDIESRMIMIILTKPVKRTEYLIGKYLGIMIICLSFFITASLAMIITHFAETGHFYNFSLLVRQTYLIFAIFPFVAMTMMISTFLSDIGAMIMASIYLLFSICMSAMSIFVDMLPNSLGVSSYVHLIAYFFPNYLYFFNSFRIFGFVMVSLFAYSLSLTFIFLMIAAFRLNSRDML